MTIYIDVIILENIVMNYIILLATAIILKANKNPIRLFLASLIGAVYAVVSFMNILEIYTSIYMKIVLSGVMVYLCFTPKTIKQMLKQVLLFYLTSFVFGGCAFFLLYVVRPQDILMRNGVYIGTYPIKIALLGAMIGYIIVTIAFKMVKVKMSKKDYFCEVTVDLLRQRKSFTAMIDTGNLLKDPISGVPVMVIERESLEGFFPRSILENIENIMKGEKTEGIEREYMAKLRMIPFQSLGKQNGLLLGIKAERATIAKEEMEEKKIEDIIIGIYPYTLSKTKKYNALIGLEMLQNSAEKKMDSREGILR